MLGQSCKPKEMLAGRLKACYGSTTKVVTLSRKQSITDLNRLTGSCLPTWWAPRPDLNKAPLPNSQLLTVCSV